MCKQNQQHNMLDVSICPTSTYNVNDYYNKLGNELWVSDCRASSMRDGPQVYYYFMVQFLHTGLRIGRKRQAW